MADSARSQHGPGVLAAFAAAAAAASGPWATHWVRTGRPPASCYVMLALGINNRSWATPACWTSAMSPSMPWAPYLFALLTSPHLSDHFAWIGAPVFRSGCTRPWWVTLPLGCRPGPRYSACLLGAPTLKLRGDYPRDRDLGIRGDRGASSSTTSAHPLNITDGAKGPGSDRFDPRVRPRPGQAPCRSGDFEIASVTLYYYLFLALTLLTVGISQRLQDSRIRAAPGWRSATTRSRPAAMGIDNPAT